MKRRNFPDKIKVLAALHADGYCERCGCKLMAGHIAFDHVIPDAMGGAPELGNCMVLCTNCHGAKTHKRDVPDIAKAKRRQRKHLGIKRPRSLRSWRRFDGTPVYAARER